MDFSWNQTPTPAALLAAARRHHAIGDNRLPSPVPPEAGKEGATEPSTRAARMLNAVQSAKSHSALSQPNAQHPMEATVSGGQDNTQHERARALLSAVVSAGESHQPFTPTIPPSMVFDFSRAAAERRARAAEAAVSCPKRSLVGHPAQPAQSLSSSSPPATEQGGATPLNAAGLSMSPEETIITMVKGRLYKPAAPPSGFARFGAAVASALKRRAVSAPHAYPLARELFPSIPAGTNRRRRPGLSNPEEEPDLDPPGTAAEKRDRQVKAEVERTLSLFAPDMAQNMLPYSAEEIAQAARCQGQKNH